MFPSWLFGQFGAADTGIDHTALAGANGSTFTLPAGNYLLTVEVEPVSVVVGAAVLAAITPATVLRAGTQIGHTALTAETWACRSANGTGKLTFTRARVR
jgi:hypothetical protein